MDSVQQTKRPRFLRRWIPHPILTIVLFVLWLALTNQPQFSSVLIGFALAAMIPVITRQIWFNSPKLARYGGVFMYIVIVLADVIAANIQVAWLIVIRPRGSLRSRWFTVPLDVTSDEAIAALAATITLTPGTVSCDLSSDRRSMLVHGLDVAEVAPLVTHIKKRYEARLKAIFPC
ncbi:MAG TPA: Na+/H+ antiporter subunit E [Pirellulaceae bacterium]|nr:Na+/H+ antiporter subunit E [Pirellulaceae bacterium]